MADIDGSMYLDLTRDGVCQERLNHSMPGSMARIDPFRFLEAPPLDRGVRGVLPLRHPRYQSRLQLPARAD
ncbi:MAG: hypothetical protein QNJ41_20120 [Xenococcaceae cyanobacterium MO_188.B32]|nr:hypothetical protein [Xenococcaceae cyanobacterium MO_188.B32]